MDQNHRKRKPPTSAPIAPSRSTRSIPRPANRPGRLAASRPTKPPVRKIKRMVKIENGSVTRILSSGQGTPQDAVDHGFLAIAGQARAGGEKQGGEFAFEKKVPKFAPMLQFVQVGENEVSRAEITSDRIGATQHRRI